MTDAEPTFFAAPEEFRAWLEAHHETASELLVGFYKVKTGIPSMTWSESVDEALCFGWIDGKGRRIDDKSHTIRFTPRRKGSIWSAVNVTKVTTLTEEGRMRPAGIAAYQARREDRTAIYSFERDEPAAFSPEHNAQLLANAAAREFFENQAPWYQRAATHWVVSAKRQDTRDRRMATLIDDSAVGRRIKHLDRSATSNATAS
jgi:uncharacterized protein YdeI (YjbR/CyaY-like superfamily)